MKNWILTHKRLYFVIVGIIAFVAFALITLLGVKRMASAATHETSVTVPWGDAQVTIELGDYDYYLVIYDASGVEGYADVILSDTPVLVNDNMNVVISGVGCRFSKENYSDEPIEQSIVNGLEVGYQGRWTSLRANYDVLKENTNEVYSPANPFVKPNVFDKDAPYIKFKRLNVRNKLASGDYTSLDWVNPINDMDKYIEEAYWEYCGYIENFKGAAGYQYTLDINFTVEFPHLMYVVDWMNINNVGHTQTELMTNIPLMIAEWNLTNSNQKYVFTTSASIPVIPNDDGYFSFRFSFLELCQLLVKGDPDALELFDNLDKMFESFIIPGLHVDSVASLLTTVSNGSSVIGKYSIDYFERGVLNDAMSVYIDLGSLGDTEEERDEAIRDAVSEAVKEQNKELQDRVDGLEEELEHIYAVDGTLSGELSSTDLWNGFWNLSRGLANVGNSVSSISVLTGQVFGFMPSPVTSIMQFTLVAICVIAIIKAIRG